MDRPLTLVVNGHPVTSGSILIAPNTAHSSDSGTASRMAWIHLDPLYRLDGLTKRMGQIDQSCWIDHDAEDDLRRSINGFLRNPDRPEQLGRALADWLCASAVCSGPVDPRIARALEMLGADPGEPISLGDISRRLGMSESNFRHLFKSATGVTFRRYRLWVRIKLAAELIHAGASLTEAAHEAGFSSSAHLSFAYRNLCGVAPSVMLAVMKGGKRPSEISCLAT